MTNQAYGYVLASASSSEVRRLVEKSVSECSLGLEFLQLAELYALPRSLREAGREAVCFRIADYPDDHDASYLIDFEDYAPEARIGLPLAGEERLGLLVQAVLKIVESPVVSRIVICVTDCDQLEGFPEKVPPEALYSTMLRDFRKCAPPNKAYIV